MRLKKTIWIEFISILKRTWISFVTVFILTAAGVGVFTGFEWGVKATELSVDKVYRDQNFHSYEVFCSSGIRGDIPGALSPADAEGVIFAYRFFDHGDRRVQAKIFSMTEKIDVLFQVEGELPDGPSELVLEKYFAEQNGFGIGDRICFEDADNIMLPEQEFTITALAESPAYLSNEASSYGIHPDALDPVDCLMYVSPEAFSDVFGGYFTEMLVAGDIAEDELKERLTEVSGLDAEEFSIITRSGNLAENIIDNSIDSFRKLKYSMGLMLIIISQAVSFIFLGKVVSSQRKNVGMKKAIGFRSGEIMLPYLLYGASSAFLGAVTGIVLGRFVLETVFLDINQAEVFFTEAVTYSSVPEAAALIAGETALSVLIVFLAVRKVLSLQALDLLNGRDDSQLSEGLLEKTSWWKRLPVLSQAAINNMRSGRSQRGSMVLCIAGCCLLLVSSLTVRDLVAGSFVRHYDAIQDYDSLIYFDRNSESAESSIRGLLAENGSSAALLHVEYGAIEDEDEKGVGAYLFVPLDGEYEKVFRFLNTDGTAQKTPEDGTVRISQAYAEHYGLKEGDSIRYLDGGGKETELEIGAVCEYYLQMPCIHMSAELYRRIFGTEPEGNAFAAVTGKTAASGIFEELRSTEGYIVTYDLYTASKTSFDNMSFVCTTVVIIFTLLSLVMAVFVILSLIQSAVESRKREIIVMKINGVARSRIIRYVYTDLAVYALIGIVLGNIGGYWFGRLTTRLLSGYTDCFLKNVSVRALAAGTGICVLLVLVMGLLSMRKLDGFGLADLSEDTEG